MNTEERMNGSADKSLSERLLSAYKRVAKNYRALARRDFCEEFDVTDDSFRAKRCGKQGYPVTEQECEWMEAYKPIVVPS